ncbi:unnamed protein product [Adineta steineri]|uniref:Uncharacterized protein n=1 Tax=Adineta steineri TaxID=433720 RepID=A0A814AZV3_9BILA|nr:unnamed protein product [Adineta steineri]CAF0922337.1 unnamed protein product [Adineta steineri]
MHKSTPPKPKILVWTDISHDQMIKLEELHDSESIHEFFIKIFGFERNTKRTKILCDLFYYALNFARTNTFNHEQTSAFLSILKQVHDMSVHTPYANMEETYQYFKALILKHSLFRPPHHLRIFTPNLTKKITDYIIDTYFRHIKMYKYIFTPYIDFHLNFTYEGIKQQISKTEGGEEQHETENIDTNNEQKNEEPSDLVEVRKLIQTYMKEELRKIENPTEGRELQTPTDKHRRIRSGSSKSSSKSRTPK